MTMCDGCGKCVELCPSDIMHIDPVNRRAFNVEPDMCWECYTCVKYCPEHAIDVRGYADFAPLGHGVTVLREAEKGAVSWKIKYRDGRIKEFTFPIRTTRWGTIPSARSLPPPADDALHSPLLSHEPEYLKVESLPTLKIAEQSPVAAQTGNRK